MSARDWAFLAGFTTCVVMDLLWSFGRGFVEAGRRHRTRCVAHDRKAVVWYSVTHNGQRGRVGSCDIPGCVEATMEGLKRRVGVA